MHGGNLQFDISNWCPICLSKKTNTISTSSLHLKNKSLNRRPFYSPLQLCQTPAYLLGFAQILILIPIPCIQREDVRQECNLNWIEILWRISSKLDSGIFWGYYYECHYGTGKWNLLIKFFKETHVLKELSNLGLGIFSLKTLTHLFDQ